MKKSNPTIKAQILRSAFYVLLLLGICAIPFALAKRSFDGRTTSATSSTQTPRTLSFADRVAYQRAIEEVYWQHRIWPKEQSGPKPPLEKMMSQAEIEKKVEDYLRNSQALEDYWRRPITPDQLQAEMERIARHSRQPEVLREIFAALGNDPFVIAECLARPVLAERLLSELYAHDQRFHGELKRRAEAELRAHGSVRQMKQTSGMYTEMEWMKSDSADPVEAAVSPAQPTRLPSQKPADTKNANAVMMKGKDRLKLATVAWLKEPLRSWLAKAEAQAPVTMAAVSTNYTLPMISSPSGGCTDDTWTPTSLTNAPIARSGHTAVWTGSEMIVWGGAGMNTGGRYNPVTDSWTDTSTTNAPSERSGHTAVWTGSEMIVWGGSPTLNTGGRYN